MSGLCRAASHSGIEVALLTGGGDSPYAFGLTQALANQWVRLDLVAGDELDTPEIRVMSDVTFLNLRGSSEPTSSLPVKTFRVLAYYSRLLRYAASARPKLFHILWNNKFQVIDRTLLMWLYRLLGKKVVLTVHNVNAARRDSNDNLLNRATLRVQYRLAEHLFVHTERMKQELVDHFGIRANAVTVIPFGINNAVPHTTLTSLEARQRLGIEPSEKTVLFFGNIAPYKGLEYLVAAFEQLTARASDYRLLIAGRPKGPREYWDRIRQSLERIPADRVIVRADYVSDADTEVFFKAADLLVLPYTEIFQSGVLFLGYSFGLPVLAADVGSLKDDIVCGKTGFVVEPRNNVALANSIGCYFASELFANLPTERAAIRRYAEERHSWKAIGEMTRGVYASVLRGRGANP